MRVLFDIGHPAHVHLFRNARRILQDRGHETVVVSRDKEVARDLLDAYEIPYLPGSRKRDGWRRGFELFEWYAAVRRAIKKNRIDVVASIGSPSGAWAARRSGIPFLAFNDTEIAHKQRLLYAPASTAIFTPKCLLGDFGPKQIRYEGLHDLAYLRPEYFTPDPVVRDDLGLSQGESFALIRFVSWDATHDWGKEKMGLEAKRKILEAMARRHRVFISAEGELPEDLRPYRLRLAPHRLHDALALASAVIGDGATTATEAAVLGTPSLYISDLTKDLGCLLLLSEKYRLLDTASLADFNLEILEEFLTSPRGDERQSERTRLLTDTIDVSAYIAEQCEKYGANRA